MQSVDFKPKIHYKKSRCLPIFSKRSCINARDVESKMNNWIEKHNNNIIIVNIETFDFKFSVWSIPKSHFRIWFFDDQ